MDDDQQFCLRWNNHQSTLISVFDTLLENETLVDCTLAAEGKFLKAHKVVLSACSPYFATLLQEQYDKHPIFILKDVKYQELRAMMDYMYRGEVNISQDQLAALLKAAESLQIKGLSDNRSAGGATAPKQEHHRATMPTGKLSAGYTLEQTKRARITGPAEPEMGSREGSSSPSRRRRKVRRRSIENAMTEVHDNSNSSQQLQQQTQSNASGLGAITAAASALAAAAAAAPNNQSLASNVPLSASTSSTAVTAPGTTLSSSKKTDIVKGTTQQQTQQQDAMNTENVQGPASAATATGSLDMETTDAAATTATEKSNHKQMQQQLKQAKESISAGASGAASASDLVIEPKAEYDDEANDEPVEDLTLDEEDMGMDDLDQNAGTSQGGEGSSQGYAPWQHDRSQDELLLATQEAQQRDPQDDSTPLRSSSFLHRRRHSIRLKTSPLTSPLPPAPGVIKYEPSTVLEENDDDDDDDEDENKLVVSGLEHKPLTAGMSGNSGGCGVGRTLDEEDDDDEESEQPCDLRLSSHFNINLVSMALQQAAVAATGDQKTAAAMAAAMMSSGGAAVTGGSSGMPPASQLQQAALQTIAAAAATSHQAPHHALHHQAQQHAAAAAHHALMNFPAGAASPSRRYSTSSGGGGGAGGVAGINMSGAATGVGSAGSGVLTPSSGSTILGASTSTIVAPHTPASTGGNSGGMMGGQGVAGPGSAGATGASGSGGSGGSSTSWGGAYTCDRCGNSYARPHSLNRHVRFECGVEPKFECPICHKKSKHKHNLVLHMRTHQHR